MGKAPLRLIHALLLALSLTAGCSTIGNPVADPRAIWCETNSPRRDATADTPRSELDDINAHNRKGALWCSWVP